MREGTAHLSIEGELKSLVFFPSFFVAVVSVVVAGGGVGDDGSGGDGGSVLKFHFLDFHQPMMEGRKPENPEKASDDKVQKTPYTEAGKLRDLRPRFSFGDRRLLEKQMC